MSETDKYPKFGLYFRARNELQIAHRISGTAPVACCGCAGEKEIKVPPIAASPSTYLDTDVLRSDQYLVFGNHYKWWYR
jgi:hypothetical protein